MTLRFTKPKLIPTLATFIAVAVTFGLGIWQLERLAEKTAMLAMIEEHQSQLPLDIDNVVESDLPKLEWNNVTVTGYLMHDKELIATPRYLKERMGYAVLTPLAVSGPKGLKYVLINRGWVDPEHKTPDTRMDGNPTDEVIVEGTLRVPQPKKYFTPENRPKDNMWFWYDLPAMGEKVDLKLLPVIIDASAIRQNDGTALTEGPKPFPIEIKIRNDHFGYAITWFLIGLTAIIVYLAHYIERDKTSAGK